MEESRERSERSERRSGGSSIWSGLKQMFNNKPSPGSAQPERDPCKVGQKKLHHSAYSYSCLGNSRYLLLSYCSNQSISVIQGGLMRTCTRDQQDPRHYLETFLTLMKASFKWTLMLFR